MDRTNTRTRKGSKIAIVTAALLLGVGGTAFAYWTQMGDGEGAAGTGNTVDVIVNQTSVINGLYPGGPAQPLSGDFDNPNPGDITVGAVSATVTATSVPACDADWYTIGGTGSPATQVLEPGDDVGGWSGLTVALVDEPVNQDACKNATITISYEVAAA